MSFESIVNVLTHAFFYAVGHWNIFPSCCDIILGS